ncbi:MAG: hypothetical protein HUJ31_16330, partial [Pseudomonadales bacterium]|nr:hypothetical protein [Pseudomonadales bacterium]
MRILEFGNDVSAGYCGRLFALWGADVIRVDGTNTPPASEAEQSLDCYLHAGKRRVLL